MSVKLVLYGELREKTGIKEKDIYIEENEIETIKDLLEKLGIGEEEISHIFLDHDYSSSSRKLTEENDRVAIFPKNMALLYKWYFSKQD